jgi:hypothetical protein
MVSATGNAIRDQILYAAIRKLTGEITFEATVAALPNDFDLDETEYNGAIKILDLYGAPDDPEPPQGERTAPLMIDKTPDGKHSLIPKTLEKIGAPRAPLPERPPIATARATPEPVRLTAIQANHAVLEAQRRLGEGRIVLQRARDAKIKAQGALANAITIWQTGMPPYTQENLIRDHLRSEQEKRRQRIEGGAPPQAKTHGHSAIDIAAAYSKDNSPEGFARSRFENGRQRGAFPKSALHQKNYDPRRGPVFKPPVKA